MANILSNPLLGPFIKGSNARLYAKGQTILYPDDKSDFLHVIKEGAVAMQRIDKHGNKKVLFVFGPSKLFPMVSFLKNSVSSEWFYVTLADTEVYMIPYKQLKEKLKQTDGLTAYDALLRQSLADAHELLLHISDLSKTSSEEKLVAKLLFLLAHHTKAKATTWRPVQFPIPHQLLADMTGLTRETVSLTMKELGEQKLVRYRSKGCLELNSKRLSKKEHQ